MVEDITKAIKEAYIALAAVEAEPPVIPETQDMTRYFTLRVNYHERVTNQHPVGDGRQNNPLRLARTWTSERQDATRNIFITERESTISKIRRSNVAHWVRPISVRCVSTNGSAMKIGMG